jgi:DnaK suppressor protein
MPEKTNANAKSKAKAAKSKATTKTTSTKKATAAPKVKATAGKSGTAAKRKTPAKTRAKSSAASNFTNFEPYQAKRNEDYMNEAQQEHFKSILLAWKAELMEEVDRTVSHMKDEAANFPDPADRATQEEEFSLELRTRDRERKLIKKIESTMELIDQDDYGYCNSCGVEIGIKRLEARPTANLCIDCKTLDEIREKQQHG